MKPGDLLTVDIESINSEGAGVARLGEEHFVIFIANTLPGERVKARVTRVSKKYAVANAVDLLHPSEERVTPPCPIYYKCGGCQLQHASYPLQLRLKAGILSDALRRIGGIQLPGQIECAPSPEEWHYRNKTSLPVQQRKGRLIAGYYERRSHNIVPLSQCMILKPALEKTLLNAVDMLQQSGLKGYDERTSAGDIRFIVARAGGAEEENETLAAFVAAREPEKREFGRLRDLCQKMAARDRGLVGSVLNVKTGRDNFIWGPLFKNLHGRRLIDQHLDGHRFQLDISAFFQVNRAQTERLFRFVRALLDDDNRPASILELYSGVGSLTAYLAENATKIDAVEEWRPAVKQFLSNMELNGIDNVSVTAEAAERYMEQPGRIKPSAYETIVLDPPRTGCDERVLEGIQKIAPQNIIYISCNPATLARDTARLMGEHSYRLDRVAAFDMFPQTSHVEAVAHFSKNI